MLALRLARPCLLLMLLTCCLRAHPAALQEGATHQINLVASGKRRPLKLWLACDAVHHARGLMGKRSLGQADGMLFVFDRAAPRSFWMHDTLLPLDMLFFDDTGRLTCLIDAAEPQTDTPRPCALPSRYVVELVGGTAASWGLGADTRLDPHEVAPLCQGRP